jgi:pimeloyl-ACP methyl ester carboxylesterase
MRRPRGKDRFGRIGLVAIAAAATALSLAGPAQGRERVITVKAPPAAGPASYDKVFVHQFGPAKGKKVLVLMPGTSGGAGDFTLAARHLVKQIKGLQVWSIDRRTQAIEDTDMFEAALKGNATLQQMFDYYLGWIDGATPPSQFVFKDGNAFPFARDWGMKVALADARAVVKLANRRNRRVVLGGHSLGASLAAAYAAWDFKGRAGFRDLDGIVLIDGGLLGSFDAFDLQQAKDQVEALETSNPFLDLLGIGFPEAAGLFAEIGGAYARLAPDASATTTQGFSLLPDDFDPGFPVTNEALLAHAFDRDTSPPYLGLLHVNAGGLAAAGDPRPWVDGGITPASRLADTFGQEPSNGVEWYFPKRLTIDTNGANQMRRNAVARFLGLRLSHTNRIDIPIYAIQTDLTDGGVLRGARRLVKRARTRKRQSMLVNGDPVQSHLDPLTAAPATNLFFKSVEKFLRRKAF